MASKNYDPVKAHEYYMKHRKLKGRKKGRKGSSSKAKGKREKAPKKVTFTSMLKDLEKDLNPDGLRQAEIEKQKIDNEKKEFDKKLKEKWDKKIKEIEEKIKKATDEEKEALKTELATLQVDYKQEKKLVKDYYDAKKVKEVEKISQNEGMRLQNDSSK